MAYHKEVIILMQEDKYPYREDYQDNKHHEEQLLHPLV
jgi:hypothetical protein